MLYHKSYRPKWGWIVGGVVLGASISAFTGGAATPLVTSIGTAIGENLLGLSGAAATNAGLALLGGGSLASGGYGMAGGALLISGVLSFTTDVSIDYAAYSLGKPNFAYQALVADSKYLLPLPLPNDDDLTPAYENAFPWLKQIDKELPIHDDSNQELLRSAICSMLDAYVNPVSNNNFLNWLLPAEPPQNIQLKDQILLSILYFLTNDYATAKQFSSSALQHLEESHVARTVPQYISAVSALYEEKFDMGVILKAYLRPALVEESGNKLIPLLLAIALDRMMLRFEDGQVSIADLKHLRAILDEEPLRYLREDNYKILMSRYMLRLKYNQQQILVLAQTSNATLLNSPLTRQELERSFTEYKMILQDALPVYHLLSKGKKESVELVSAWPEYDADRDRLRTLVENFNE